MNFQYYESLQDKSTKNLLNLVDKIVPKFTKKEFQIYLDEFSAKPVKGSKSKSNKFFIDIGEDSDTVVKLSNLKLDQLKLMYQSFISKERNDMLVIKWRFYQYFKYTQGIIVENIKINRSNDPEQLIDFIIKTDDKKIIFVLASDIFTLKNYNTGLEKVASFSQKEKIFPDRIIFATNKTYRNIPIDDPIEIGNKEIVPELWVEIYDIDRPFNEEDLIIVNNSELKLAGFNFTNLDGLLEYVYEFSEGGQVSIYKQADYYSDVVNDEPEVQLIWRGIMLKNN